jgi:hypothetical protein
MAIGTAVELCQIRHERFSANGWEIIVPLLMISTLIVMWNEEHDISKMRASMPAAMFLNGQVFSVDHMLECEKGCALPHRSTASWEVETSRRHRVGRKYLDN